MTALGWLIQNYPVITTIITGLFGAFSTIAFNALKKRKEEVTVTGTEHDTVKRISQSSIETIERLNTSFEQLSEKLIKQRQEFSIKFDEMNLKLEDSISQNKELKDQLSHAEEKIQELTFELEKRMGHEMALQKTITELTEQVKKLNDGIIK